MIDYNKEKSKQFYNEICTKIDGYDFSSINVINEGVKWYFYKEVKKLCDENSLVLDVGTGGGERFLKLANYVYLLVGIDISENMIKTAKNNLRNKSIENAFFCEMDSDQVKFPDGFFDIISCRLSYFNSLEVARLLAKDGIFITQQAGQDDKLNIKKFFGRGYNSEIRDNRSKKLLVNQLKEAGFLEVKTLEYNATEYYKTKKDLLFILNNTPLLPDFGKCKADLHKLNKFVNKFNTKKGIKTNLSRYMIIAKK